MIDECRKMFESRIFAAAIEPHAKMVPWTYDMEGSAKKCVGRYCKLAVEKTEQLYKVSTICLDDHNFKKGGTGNSWRNVKTYAPTLS